ncbi:MAG: hypothetical protein FIA97_10850 [Methylococcaceae bacterium]|nr:hypothetical protein [Methylococcaceae bacterium]
MLEELLVGLSLAFVGYFLYNVYKTVSETNSASQQSSATAAAPVSEPAPAAAANKSEAAVSVAESAAAPAQPSAESAEEKIIVLRDPATGETTPVPSNYRFAKKWVKEALVSEGLLSKVYKNSELKGPVSNQVKEALEKFKNIEKFQA